MREDNNRRINFSKGETEQQHCTLHADGAWLNELG